VHSVNVGILQERDNLLQRPFFFEIVLAKENGNEKIESKKANHN
jgi:hypothetical protein